MTERRLLWLASGFLVVYALALTISPAARQHSWAAEYRWQHWLGLVVWAGLSWLAHFQLNRRLPERDEYIFPVAALLSGWGLLSVWRLLPEFGLRQSAWLAASLAILVLGLRLPANLAFLYRYKYIWLSAGLLLTAATLLLGTNPMGKAAGPGLWLGCCGLYLQPSELLKLLLIVYLSAYLADRLGKHKAVRHGWLPLLAPTLLVTGLALLLLFFQRDLGTASLFLCLYATMLYTSTGKKRVILLSGLALVVAAVAGYFWFDVVRLRIDAWLNPWLEPSTRSYQIVQSLIAVASGGIFGRGVGLGSPGLVPVVQSDFIFAAIAEEQGLWGALGLLLMLALLVNRGIRAALHAATPFQRILAAGITTHLGAQSILIIGGNLRMLPLTGVTLPFVSYGGSSLVTAYLEILLLLLVSVPGDRQAPQVFDIRPYHRLAGGLLAGLAAAALLAGWWGLWRGPELVTRTDNVRRSIADRYVLRGAILSQEGTPLSRSQGEAGEYQRVYDYPNLGSILGYTHPVYGQAGLEASLDDYLRGLQGNSQLSVWWNHLVYGQPPPGLDVRLSLDLELQRKADELLEGRGGALVLLNAKSGEVLAMASHPSFDANQLGTAWESLISDPDTPLVNRAALGLYPTGSATGAWLLAAQPAPGRLTELTPSESQLAECALIPPNATWGALVSNGCPWAVTSLGEKLGVETLNRLYTALGFYGAPEILLETAAWPDVEGWSATSSAALGGPDPVTGKKLLASPLQMALAAASLSQDGSRPAPRLAVAVNTPQAGWVILPELSQAESPLTPAAAQTASQMLAVAELPIWQVTARALGDSGEVYTWHLSGTLPDWPGAPLALAVLLEEDDPQGAMEIGELLFEEALQH